MYFQVKRFSEGIKSIHICRQPAGSRISCQVICTSLWAAQWFAGHLPQHHNTWKASACTEPGHTRHVRPHSHSLYAIRELTT